MRGPLACRVLVLCALVVSLIVPLPDLALGQSCPPGWESCTGWAYDGACCCCLYAVYLGSNQSRQCTRWDHAINAYPNCTYQVVAQWTENRCKSPLC